MLGAALAKMGSVNKRASRMYIEQSRLAPGGFPQEMIKGSGYHKVSLCAQGVIRRFEAKCSSNLSGTRAWLAESGPNVSPP